MAKYAQLVPNMVSWDLPSSEWFDDFVMEENYAHLFEYNFNVLPFFFIPSACSTTISNRFAPNFLELCILMQNIDTPGFF